MDETSQVPSRIECQGLVYEDRNQRITRVLAHFDGFSKEYFVSDYGQRSAVVVLRDGEVLLVRQYRLLINGLSYEIPGGKVDENEMPEAAAARECLEECGVRCSNLKPLISYEQSLDISKNITFIYYSEEAEETTEANSDRRVWIPLEQCMSMVVNRKIVDSLSVIGVLAYYTLIDRRRVIGF